MSSSTAASPASLNGPPLIQARGLTKYYGTIVASEGVDFELGHGEIVAVVGDNGAGKSTLVKMISGAVTPDAGEIRVDGRVATIRSPIEARGYGIETIYQDLAMPPNLDVVTNIYLGRERRRSGPLGLLGAIDRKGMREDVKSHLSDLKINIPKLSGTAVESLSGGQRQSVAIARAMVWASKVLIMDEPTAALGVKQSAAVLEIVKEIRQRGISVVIISHILPHVLELADRIVVMRHGRKVADVPAGELDEHKLIELIVGFRTSGAAKGGVVNYPALDHVGFAVSDLDHSVEWYTRFLGEEPVLRKVWGPGYVGRIVGYPECSMDCAIWRLPNDTLLELIQYLAPPPDTVDMETYNVGNAHLCLETQDIEADYERLRDHAEFRSAEPVEIPWGPYKGGRVCYLRDPDGISVELMQQPPGGPNLEA